MKPPGVTICSTQSNGLLSPRRESTEAISFCPADGASASPSTSPFFTSCPVTTAGSVTAWAWPRSSLGSVSVNSDSDSTINGRGAEAPSSSIRRTQYTPGLASSGSSTSSSPFFSPAVILGPGRSTQACTGQCPSVPSTTTVVCSPKRAPEGEKPTTLGGAASSGLARETATTHAAISPFAQTRAPLQKPGSSR